MLEAKASMTRARTDSSSSSGSTSSEENYLSTPQNIADPGNKEALAPVPLPAPRATISLRLDDGKAENSSSNNTHQHLPAVLEIEEGQLPERSDIRVPQYDSGMLTLT